MGERLAVNATRLLLSLVVLAGVSFQGAAASMTASVATAGSIQAGVMPPPLLVPRAGDIEVGKSAPDPRRGVAFEIPVAVGALAGELDPLALRVVGFFLGMMLAVAAHEVGHLVCAVAASIAVRLISIGVGPLLLRLRIGETWFELRLVAAAGFVSIYPLSIVRKFRQALFLLGGVLANALVLAVVAALGLVGAFPAWLAEWGDLIGPIVFMQAYMIMVNLIPFMVQVQGARLPSDGLQLLQLWSAPRGATALGLVYAELAKLYRAGSVAVPNSPVWSRIMFNLSHARRWTDPEARRAIHESLIRELARGPLPTEAEGLVLDGLITDGLVFSEPLLRSRLDAWSLRAIEIAPDVKTLRGSAAIRRAGTSSRRWSPRRTSSRSTTS